MPRFLDGKPRGGFGQQAFFLAGNRMTTIVLKRFFSKLSFFNKTIQFDRREV